MNSSVGSLNTDYDNATSSAKITEIGDDIRSKQTLRNILYGVSGAAVVGFGVTFIF